MLLTPPSASNGYTVTAEHELSPELMNAIFGDVHVRLVDLEALKLDAQLAIDQVLALSAETVNATLDEEIANGRAGLAEVKGEFQVLRDEYETLQAGGLSASRIQITPIEGLAGNTVQAALAALMARIPLTAAGDAGKFVRVNAGGTGFEFGVVSFDAVNASLAAQTAMSLLLERQTRLNALYIAELRGDRMNMVDGIADPFTDASDISGSSYTITSGVLHPTWGIGSNIATAARVISAINDPTNTPSMAFDGNSTTYCQNNSDGGWIGQDFVQKTVIFRAVIINQATYGDGSPTTMHLEWSDDGASYTPVANATTVKTNGGSTIINAPLSAGAHRYWRVRGQGVTQSFNWTIGELQMFAPLPASSMDIASVAFPSDVSNPTLARLALIVSPPLVGTALVMNTDLKSYVSRNGGGSFKQVTLAAVETLADGSVLYEGFVDLSAELAGSSMKYRHVTANAKDVRISGTIMQWRA